MTVRTKLLVLPALVAALMAAPAWAGRATLEAKEFEALRRIVATDASAKAAFAKERALADQALREKPEPVPLLDGAGRMTADPIRVKSRAATAQLRRTSALAWTWAVTGEARYAEKAYEIIGAWVKVNRTVGQPINETGLEPLVEAYDLIRHEYPDREREEVDAWLRARAQAIWSTREDRRYNWQSHRIKMVALIATTIGDDRLWRTAIESSDGYRWQVGDTFDAKGESIDFRRRDALHYHLYTVDPLLLVACLGERRNERLFSYKAPNGASLERAVEFLRPYSLGEKKHTEFVNSQVRADRDRAADGQKDFSQHEWRPSAAVSTYSDASCVNPAYAKMAARVKGTPEDRFVDWRGVVVAAMRAR
jgi:hypothetical protein